MAKLVYNNINLGSYVHTKEIDDEVVLEPSGTDYLHTLRKITVAAVIHPSIVPAVDGEKRSETMRRIAHELEVPRKRLQYWDDASLATPFIESPAPGKDVDAANGPFPKVLKITEVKGTELFHILYTITTAVVECRGGNIPPYSTHRWRDVITVDNKFCTRRHRSGLITRRSDSDIDQNELVDLAYGEAGLVPPDFQREQAVYTFQDDGLAVAYDFLDVEQYLAPPAPSVKSSGRYRETTNTVGGAVRFAEVQVTLEGANVGKEPDYQWGKFALLEMAILVAANHIQLGKQVVWADGSVSDVKMSGGAIEVELYGNTASVMFRAMIPPGTGRIGGVPEPTLNFIRYPTGSEPLTAVMPSGGIRGTAQLMQLLAALGDPCLSRSILVAEPPPEDPDNNLKVILERWNPERYQQAELRRVGQLPRDQRGLWSQPPPGSTTIRADVVTEEEYDDGMLSIMTTEGVERIKVARPTVQKTVRLDGKTQGEKPRLIAAPRAKDIDGNLIPVEKANIQLGAPKPAGDGTDLELVQMGTVKFAPIDAESATIGIAKHPTVIVGVGDWNTPVRYDGDGAVDIFGAGSTKVRDFLGEDEAGEAK